MLIILCLNKIIHPTLQFMITEDSINFLKNTPPYQFLKEPAIRAIAGNLALEFFPKNTLILTQDGTPSDSLRIIKKGGVKI